MVVMGNKENIRTLVVEVLSYLLDMDVKNSVKIEVYGEKTLRSTSVSYDI